MTSKYMFHLFLAAGLAALLCPSTASAQPAEGEKQGQRGQSGQRGDRGSRGGGPRGQFGQRGRSVASITSVALLRIEQIREELKLDEGQAETIDAAIEAFREERREGEGSRDSFQNLSDQEREDLRDQRQAAQQELTKRTDEVIAVLLNPEQNTRLRELIIQFKMKANPTGTLKSDDIKTSLNISEDQVARIDEIEELMRNERSAVRQAMRQAFSSQKGERPDFTQIRERMRSLNQKFSQQVLEVLTADQSSQLQALQGEMLDVDLRAFRGNRRGGRGRDRNSY